MKIATYVGYRSRRPANQTKSIALRAGIVSLHAIFIRSYTSELEVR